MLVKNWMSKPAITVNSDAMQVDAINLLQKNEISVNNRLKYHSHYI